MPTVLQVAFPFAPVSRDSVGGAEQIAAACDEAVVRAGHRSIVVACEGSKIAGELILNPIIEEAGKRSFQPCFDSTKIVAAELGADGVAIGAALLARDARNWE